MMQYMKFKFVRQTDDQISIREYEPIRIRYLRLIHQIQNPPIKISIEIVSLYQDMGKKIAKAQKPEKKESTKKASQKISDEPEADLQIFTSKFYDTLNSFKAFYKNVLELKSKEQNTDLSSEFETVRAKVSEEIEIASTKILREELVSVEKWIAQQQDRISDEIKKVEEAYNKNKSTLEASGAFSQAEIKDQVAPIQARIEEKIQTLKLYGDLLQKSKEVYQ